MRRKDDLERLRSQFHQIETELDSLRSRFTLMQQEWAETLERVTKAFKRVERANQRAALGVPPEELPEAVAEPSDPFSRKLAQIRRQGGALP